MAQASGSEMDGKSDKPECSVIWSKETDCLGNLQKEMCLFENHFDCLNIKQFTYLVTDKLPLQAVPLCPRHVWSCCVPGTWHIFPHPGPPWPKLVKKDGVHILTILRLLQFSDDHPRIHGVYSNFLWRQLQCHTPAHSVSWMVIRLN